MSSSFCVSDNVDQLKKAVKEKKIFSASLEKTTFLSILEILWNIVKGKTKCKKCFSKKSISGLKKNKKIVKKLLKSGKNVDKKKKNFLKSSQSFKKLIKRILKEFLQNCIEEDKE